jgi:hypothetical protein
LKKKQQHLQIYNMLNENRFLPPVSLLNSTFISTVIVFFFIFVMHSDGLSLCYNISNSNWYRRRDCLIPLYPQLSVPLMCLCSYIFFIFVIHSDSLSLCYNISNSSWYRRRDCLIPLCPHICRYGHSSMSRNIWHPLWRPSISACTD